MPERAVRQIDNPNDTPPAPIRDAWLWPVFGLVTCRPLVSDELWWNLSRGRAVFDGVWQPSRLLLAGDTIAEADWLGGLPFYLCLLLGGLSSLMLLKLLITGLWAWWVWSISRLLPPPIRWLFRSGVLLTAPSFAEPGSLCWDGLGLAVIVGLTGRHRDEATLPDWLRCFLVVCVWSNLAPGAVLALLAFVRATTDRPASPSPPSRSSPIWLKFLAALAGMSCTPRGPGTVWDSLQQLVPQITEAADVLKEFGWGPVWHGEWTVTKTGWALASVGTLLVGRSQFLAGWRNRLGWLLPQLIVCGSTRSLPLVTIWLVAETCRVTRGQTESGSSPRRHTGLALTCLAGAFAFTLWDGVLGDNRFGLGLNRRLDERLVLSAIPAESGAAIAHCVDLRSAGMLAWRESPPIRPYLVPNRALVNGRLRSEARLNRDLLIGWDQRHRRADGTSGGWWIELQTRGIDLIAFSVERSRLVRALEPTIWKPLSLEGPVLVYARAGDALFARPMVQMLAMRDRVDRLEWEFLPEPALGNDRLLDAIGFVTGRWDSTALLRQAAVLRAMGLRTAAMRVMRPLLVQSGPRGPARRELIECQLDFAEAECQSLGRVGRFRAETLRRLSVLKTFCGWDPARLADANTAPRDDPRLAEAVEKYLAGEPSTAAGLLTSADPEMMLTRAALWIEASRADQAVALWRSVADAEPRSRFGQVARHELEIGGH